MVERQELKKPKDHFHKTYTLLYYKHVFISPENIHILKFRKKPYILLTFRKKILVYKVTLQLPGIFNDSKTNKPVALSMNVTL